MVLPSKSLCTQHLSYSLASSGALDQTPEARHHTKARTLKLIGSSVRLFEKPLIEVAWVFMDCFVMLVIVLPDFCILNGKVTLHDNTVNLLCGLRKQSYWEPDTFKNKDLCLVVGMHFYSLYLLFYTIHIYILVTYCSSDLTP